MAKAPLSGIAASLAAKGRYGDTELLHVNRAEVDMLDAVSPGGLTRNPVTGQREAFLPFLIPLLAKMAAPAVISGMGLTGTAAAMAPAVLSGLGTALATGDPTQGLIAGVTGGLTGGLGGGAAEGAADVALEAGTEAGADAAISSGADAAIDALSNDAISRVVEAAATEPATTAATAAATEGGSGMIGGVMDWVKDNPLMAVMALSSVGSLAGGGGGAEEDDPPPYRKATPVPRSVQSYSGPTAGPSTYVAGDNSMDDSIYRYGQHGGEHMFFDPPPNSSRPILQDPNAPVQTAAGPFSLAPGGVADEFRSRMQDPNDDEFIERWRQLLGAQGRALGGTVRQTRQTPLPLETPRPPSTMRPTGLAGALRHKPPHVFAYGGPVSGPGTATSDSIPAVGPGDQPYRLSDGEYILPTWMVNAIGGGSNRAGTAKLDEMRTQGMRKGGGVKYRC